jgi:hypothetical protein
MAASAAIAYVKINRSVRKAMPPKQRRSYSIGQFPPSPQFNEKMPIWLEREFKLAKRSGTV